ncbi:hypothetical protein [Palleronia marisminoris]|uniref:hypothetical protein n=1 Tax=Palleronia marisminoris TaxID=315423 RepID=UPI000A26BC97|nr:hypothetical protein [Palleronia marisminoris]
MSVAGPKRVPKVALAVLEGVAVGTMATGLVEAVTAAGRKRQPRRRHPDLPLIDRLTVGADPTSVT